MPIYDAKNQIEKVYTISTPVSNIRAYMVLPVPETASKNCTPIPMATAAPQMTNREGMEAVIKDVSFV